METKPVKNNIVCDGYVIEDSNDNGVLDIDDKVKDARGKLPHTESIPVVRRLLDSIGVYTDRGPSFQGVARYFSSVNSMSRAHLQGDRKQGDGFREKAMLAAADNNFWNEKTSKKVSTESQRSLAQGFIAKENPTVSDFVNLVNNGLFESNPKLNPKDAQEFAQLREQSLKKGLSLAQGLAGSPKRSADDFRVYWMTGIDPQYKGLRDIQIILAKHRLEWLVEKSAAPLPGDASKAAREELSWYRRDLQDTLGMVAQEKIPVSPALLAKASDVLKNEVPPVEDFEP